MEQTTKSGTPEMTNEMAESAARIRNLRKEQERLLETVRSASRRIVKFILDDPEMRSMNKNQIISVLNGTQSTIDGIFTPKNLDEAVEMLNRRTLANSNDQAE